MIEYMVRVHSDGTQFWYKDGLRHREDGPAVIVGDSKFWYYNGLLHREDGPAIISPNGVKTYYIHGMLVDNLKVYQSKEKK